MRALINNSPRLFANFTFWPSGGRKLGVSVLSIASCRPNDIRTYLHLASSSNEY